ncbi:hypothetical protein [Streptomyces sp. NPDC014764]|uniref:hypothetical protein n=1 Tax=Streptomyces sp. NPDC014764 TaxID=3364907 RepID=UPI0036FF8819
MPPAGELNSSPISRAADRYGLPVAGVLRLRTYRNSPTRTASTARTGQTVRAVR